MPYLQRRVFSVIEYTPFLFIKVVHKILFCPHPCPEGEGEYFLSLWERIKVRDFFSNYKFLVIISFGIKKILNYSG